MARWWTPLAEGVALALGGAAATAFLTHGSSLAVAGVAGVSWVMGTGASMAANAHAERRAAAQVRANAAERRDACAVVLPVMRGHPEPRPSWLLLPDHEVGPFRGRRNELDRLLAWSESGSDGATVMVVKGAAGVGKTRLLIQFAHDVAGERVVVRVRPGKEEALIEALLALGDAAVVVVDLKEPRAGLAALLLAADRTKGRVKVVVECRSDGWLRSPQLALDETDRQLTDRSAPLEVLPIGGVEDLQRWLEEGTGASARLLEIPLPDRPPRSMTAGTSMLVVQAYGVAEVLNAGRAQATGPGDGPRPVLAEVADDLLDHERRGWSLPPGTAVDDTVAARAVCVLTLLGAEDETDAAAVLVRVPDLAGPGGEQQRRSVARWVHGLYPAGRGLDWIGRLEPDVLGQALHAQVLADPVVIEQVSNPTLSARQLRRALSHLMPALATFPVLTHAVQALLAASPLRELPETLLAALYLDNPHRADLLLAEHLLAHPEPADLDALEQSLDPRLLRTQVALLQLRVDRARQNADRALLALAVRSLGAGLDRVGRYAEALAAEQEAVGLFRELDRDDRAVHRPGLAEAVRSLGVGLERVGRYAEALAAEQEAVGLYRGLAKESSQLYGGLYADTEADVRRLEAGGWH